MVSHSKIQIQTSPQKFNEITQDVAHELSRLNTDLRPGLLHLFLMHTSCALCINEAFDPSAKKDLESFFDHLAPRSLPFITHTAEGPDDSPSHMKSVLLQPGLTLFVGDDGKLEMGQWQGIYLCEFRDNPSARQVRLKFCPD